ncbi:MAG: ABC transporter permease [Gammaproteobacteria bacterium]
MNLSRWYGLTTRLAAREVALRYRGSLGGLGWMLLAPLLLLGVYTFVFAVIFHARWPVAGGGGGTTGTGTTGEYALVVFSGMLLHGFFAECLTRAPSLILGNVNFVQKTVFPLEVLALAQLLAALVHLAATLVVLLVFQWFIQGPPALTTLLLPLVIAPVALFALGLMWIVGALTVYFRDLAQLVGLLVTALFFLSPVLYPISAVPEFLRPLLYANPLTFAIETARGLLFAGVLPEPRAYLLYCLAALACAGAGLWGFRVLRDGFADAL